MRVELSNKAPRGRARGALCAVGPAGGDPGGQRGPGHNQRCDGPDCRHSPGAVLTTMNLVNYASRIFCPMLRVFRHCAFTSNHDARQMGCAAKSPSPRSVWFSPRWVWFPPLAFAPVVAYFASKPLRGVKCKISCMNFHLMLSSKVPELYRLVPSLSSVHLSPHFE